MGEASERRTGGCACGAVRYAITDAPILVNNCYCTLCQRQTGATSAVNLFIESEALTHSGATTQHKVATGSGGEQVITRCAQCGTALWSSYPRLGELAFAVRVATLDDPGSVRPDAAIYTVDRMPWVTLPEGIPHFEGPYNPAELLPPERFQRLKALAERRAAMQAVAG